MDTIVDQILEKLLSERDKLHRFERLLLEQRILISRLVTIADAEDAEALHDKFTAVMQEVESSRKTIADFEALEIGEVRTALDRALSAAGLGRSGNLRFDAENLAKFAETGRPLSGGIL